MNNKQKRRVIACSIIVALLVAIWGVNPTDAPRTASSATAAYLNTLGPNVYQVSSLEDLWGMKAAIEGRKIDIVSLTGNNNSPTTIATYDYSNDPHPDATYILTSDIGPSTGPAVHLGAIAGNANAWEPISEFNGTLIGGGHTIKDLTSICIDRRDVYGSGLFASLNGANVEDLNLDNCKFAYNSVSQNYTITSGTTITNMAVFAGTIKDSTVMNVTMTNCEVDPQLPSGVSIDGAGIFAGEIDTTSCRISGIRIASSCSIGANNFGQNAPVSVTNRGTADALAVAGVIGPSPSPSPSVSPSPSPSSSPTPTASVTPTPSTTPAPPAVGDIITNSNANYQVVKGGAVAYAGPTTTKTSSSEITIPDTITTDGGTTLRVTRVLANAFKNAKNITTVRLGKYVEVVEKGAFQNCTSLKRFISSPALRIIEKNAFLDCKKLAAIKLPKTIEYLGEGCFKNCIAMKTAELGVSKKALAASVSDPVQAASAVMQAVEMLEDVIDLQIADVLKVTISASVFQNCANLRKVIINCQVQTIGNLAFSRCSKLSAIVVYSKILKTVGKKALTGVHHCKISVPKIKLKPYKKLFKNRGQGKKVVMAKL